MAPPETDEFIADAPGRAATLSKMAASIGSSNHDATSAN